MKPYPIKFVSIVIPVYNERQSLPELLRRTEMACHQLNQPFEIVLVDDGSRDDSAEILQQAAERNGSPFVAVILNRNYGQHAAIMAGFEQCKGDVVVTLDADLQNPPRKFPDWWRLQSRDMTLSAPYAAIVRTQPGGAGHQKSSIWRCSVPPVWP